IAAVLILKNEEAAGRGDIHIALRIFCNAIQSTGSAVDAKQVAGKLAKVAAVRVPYINTPVVYRDNLSGIVGCYCCRCDIGSRMFRSSDIRPFAARKSKQVVENSSCPDSSIYVFCYTINNVVVRVLEL